MESSHNYEFPLFSITGDRYPRAGDLAKAVSAGNPVKIKAVYKKLAEAKIILCTAESKKMGPRSAVKVLVTGERLRLSVSGDR